jgi:hypothetical protein
MGKRLIALLALLPLLAMGGGQNVMTGNHRHVFAATGGCPFIDSFSGSGALSASWSVATSETSSGYSLVKASGVVQNSAIGVHATEIVTGSSCTFPEDQYAQATIQALDSSSADGISLAVLMTTTGNGYRFVAFGGGGAPIISRDTAGAGTTLLTCGSTIPVGAVMRLTVSGSGSGQTLTAYVNGTQVCAVVDSTYTSGYPGIRIGTGSATNVNQMEFGSFQAD